MTSYLIITFSFPSLHPATGTSCCFSPFMKNYFCLYLAISHIHLYTCLWWVHSESPRCTTPIYSNVKKKSFSAYLFVLLILISSQHQKLCLFFWLNLNQTNSNIWKHNLSCLPFTTYEVLLIRKRDLYDDEFSWHVCPLNRKNNNNSSNTTSTFLTTCPPGG